MDTAGEGIIREQVELKDINYCEPSSPIFTVLFFSASVVKSVKSSYTPL